MAPLRPTKLVRRLAFKGHRGKVHDMKLTADGQTIVSVAQDGILLLWDATTGLKINAVVLSNCWVIACAVSPSGRLVTTGGLDNACTVYNVDTGDDDLASNESMGLMDDFGGYAGKTAPSLMSASTITNNNRRPTNSRGGGGGPGGGGSYQMAGLWPQTPHTVLKGHKGYISSMAFPTEDRLLSASGDMSIAYWDLNRNERVSEFIDRNLGDVNSISVDPTNPNVFIGASLKTAKLWDVRVPISSQEFHGHEDDINVVR